MSQWENRLTRIRRIQDDLLLSMLDSSMQSRSRQADLIAKRIRRSVEVERKILVKLGLIR